MQPPPVPPGRLVATTIATVQLLSIAVWAGGLLALGAIVAPIVFRVVPAPTSADAMTLVFRRFDGVAIGCSVVALFAEAAFAFAPGRGRITRADLARAGSLALATALAITIGVWLSPAIAELHRGGAVRHLGAAGQELERLHHLAEALAKGEMVLLVLAFGLGVFGLGVGRASRPGPEADSPPP